MAKSMAETFYQTYEFEFDTMIETADSGQWAICMS